nr:wsv105 [Shrimp white spot syndrome virus]
MAVHTSILQKKAWEMLLQNLGTVPLRFAREKDPLNHSWTTLQVCPLLYDGTRGDRYLAIYS